MDMKQIWQSLFLILVFSSLMIIFLILFAITLIEHFRTLGLTFAVLGVVVLAILVIKLKKTFAGQDNGYSQDRPWRSYR